MYCQSLAEPVRKFAGMAEHYSQDLFKIRRIHRLAAVEYIREVAKQPGPAQTAAANDDAVAMSLAHHSKRILTFPDIAVAQNGNPYGLFQLGDRVPGGVSVIKLCCGPRVEADCGASFVFRDSARDEKRQMIQVDSHSKFDGDRNREGVFHSGTNDVSEKARFQWNRGSALFPRYFRDRATEIHVQVIDAAFVDQALHGFGNVIGIRAVQLQTPRRLIRAEVRKLERLVATVHQRARIDHFTDV